MRDHDSNFGPRIDSVEYDRQVVALYRDTSPTPSATEELRLRRAALDLTIDHRLGRNFPAARREALWEVQRRIDHRRVLTFGKYVLRRLLGLSLSPMARGLAGYVIAEYASVLDREELEAYFGAEQVARPSLPLEEKAR